MQNVELETCVKCGNKPKIIKIGDLYYAQCTCEKWDKYAALGLSPKNAAHAWAIMNRPIRRGRAPNPYEDL